MFARFSKALHKAGFYLSGATTAYLPDALFRPFLQSRLAALSDYDEQAVMDRVNYYNRLDAPFDLGDAGVRIGDFRRDGSSAYFLDLKRLARYFPADYRMHYLFGDITHVPDVPSFLKSRPIEGDVRNSVLLKLNSVRHYYAESDLLSFEGKIGKAVWRGVDHMPWRQEFLQRYANSHFCDVGCVGKKARRPEFLKPFMSIREQLRYRYVVSIEGYDVATNLKWILRSNSLCMMRRPRFETWFMEGRLQAGVHYVELRDDHADLEEKIAWYESHPDEALQIIANARQFSRMFEDARLEELVGLLVLEKFFRYSGQLLSK
ncbi:glycosyl transferase family 90 [Marinospirillum alkaliphilum]|uniref:Glycosyl transferase family 90 n=1 Tax=Marinospirillum alkaliphilum DSM 21637 TaxID=1122209 RepID=A0A1K1U888_9GAMM|nr:glycosyl transferase family 90 [Marinospirillum alkaliphilum]SFX09038.1 Glycosyl transferase family 90 [Marinospirillum alkaliphilum DSM 21637]